MPVNSRLTILGSGFGTGGVVTFGGIPAISTEWSDAAITVYVPYRLPEGVAPVRVSNGEGASRAVTFTVVPTQLTDRNRILWRFQTGRWMNRQFIEVDGTGRVYTSDHIGTYALSPTGNLLWFAAGSGGDLPIDSDADGIVYTSVTLGTGPEIIRAHDRSGNIIWRFIPPEPGQVIAGPNVGPDGNIYAVQEIRAGEGIGLFSLSPQGDLLWSVPGDPELGPADSITNNEIIFSDDRLYFSIIRLRSGGSGVTYSFDLDGNQQWHTGTGDLHLPFYGFPRVDPFGRIVGPRGQTGVMTINEDGTVAWQHYHPGNPQVMEMAAVDANGNVFIPDWLGIEMWSLDAAGNTRWVRDSENDLFSIGVAVSTSNDVLVHAGVENFAAEGFLRGMSPIDGSVLWRHDFEPELGVQQRVNNLYPVFGHAARAGARTVRAVYVTTIFTSISTVPYGYLYAFNYQ